MRKRIKFDELIKFSVGTNLTRLNNGILDDNIYTLEDFDSDLCSLNQEFNLDQNVSSNKGVVLSKGDIIISMTRNQAGIVSARNSGKYLNSNFIKCEFDKEQLYPWYFCYLINESVTVSGQIKKLQQGTLGCINRLTINMLGSLEFTLEEIEQQKIVGDIYRNLLIQERLILKQMEDTKKYVLQMIRESDSN